MSLEKPSRKQMDSLLTAISVGFFVLLVGLLFVTTPNLVDKFVSFFDDLTYKTVPNTNVWLPIPDNVGSHSAVYMTIRNFSLAWGVFLVAMLIIRFAVKSPTGRKVDNIGDIVFWFGTAYLIQIWLVDTTRGPNRWWQFWAMLLVLLGVSLVVRAIFLVAARAMRK